MYRISALILIALLSLFGMAALQAGEPIKVSVESIHKDMVSLNGKQVQLQGKVAKVNNQIMGRNFLHIQDGTGSASAGNNDLTVTSDETAKMGDEVVIVGTVVLDHDFGSGYRYPLMVEKAAISQAK